MSVSADGKKKLRAFLDFAIESTAVEDRLANDPIGVVREFDDDADREVVAFIAASLAYGRVNLVRAAVQRAIAPLGLSPAQSLVETAADLWPEALESFVYRMTRGADLADLYAALGSVLREFGTLEALYLEVEGDHIVRTSNLVRSLRERRLRPEVERGLRYLLVDPADGSAAKRMHMFLRWVVRPADGVDLGLWSSVDAAHLIMPLDTHTSRIARYIGLSDRVTADHKAAVEVTASLAQLCPEDPLRYDFALAHLGISGRCIHRRSDEHCPSCPLEAVCRL